MRDLVRVVAEPNRRRLLELLMGGEQTVSALAARFTISQPAVSQHLAVLASAGLVDVRKEGRYRYYRVRSEGLADLRRSLDRFWTAELDDLAASRPQSDGGVVMSFEKSVLVPLDADATFALLTQPERLRRWQAVSARIELRAGGSYRFTITPGHTAAGNVLEVEPGRRLVYTWGWEGQTDLPPGASTVTVTLEPASGGTIVTLVHEGLSAEQAEGHAEGWAHYLERLVTAATTGDAGPDGWSASPPDGDPLAVVEAALATCQQVLRGVDRADRDLPTPCSKFTAAELIDHLLNSIEQLTTMAGTTRPAAATPDGAAVAGAPSTFEAEVADAAQIAVEAWRARGTEGEARLGPAPAPAVIGANILAIELLVHAWDLARATGQEMAVTDDLAGAVLGFATEVISPDMRDGDRFATAVAVSPDASGIDRLAAFTGRRP